MEIGHGDFVGWAITGAIDEFYADLRWAGWEKESSALALDEGISVYPPLFTAQASDRERSRRAIPWDELAGFHAEMRRQTQDLPEGAQVRMVVSDED